MFVRPLSVHLVPFAAALAAMLGSASAASAWPSSRGVDSGKVAVRYTAAETQTTEAAQGLAFRIRIAAAKACGGDNPLIRSGEWFTRCRLAAIDRAVGGLDAPAVAEALGRKSGATTTVRR